MATKITKESVSDKDVFEYITKSAEASTKQVAMLNKELTEDIKLQVQLAKATQANAKGAQELARLDALNAKTLQEKIKADQQLVKLEQQKERLQVQQTKEAERQAKITERQNKLTKQQTGAYSKLSKELRTLKNTYRDVALEQGKNSKAAKDLLKQITPLDNKLKQLDRTVGDNFRSVGHYERALGGLKKVLGALGITFAITQVVNFTKSLNELAQMSKGVEFAFGRLGNEGQNAFERIRESTRGLLSDLDIKKALVNFDNFNISLEETDVLMEFLAVRATQTGESIESLQSSLVEGLSKESKLRIDNLGISQKALNDELEKTPDFVQAVANIAKTQLKEAGNILDEAASGQQRWNAQLQNFQLLLANKVKPIFDTAFEKGAKMLEFVGENLETITHYMGIAIKTFVTYKAVTIVATTAIKAYNIAQSLATKGLKAFNTATKLNPFGFIASGLVLITSLFWDNTEATDANTEATDENAEAQRELNKELAEQQAILIELNKQLNEGSASIENLSTDKLKKLSEQYKENLNSTQSLVDLYGIQDSMLKGSEASVESYILTLLKSTNLTNEGVNALYDRRDALLRLSQVEKQLASRGAGGEDTTKKKVDYEKLKTDELTAYKKQKALELLEYENSLILEGLTTEDREQMMADKRISLEREVGEKIIDLNFKTDDELVKHKNKYLKDVENNYTEHLEQTKVETKKASDEELLAYGEKIAKQAEMDKEKRENDAKQREEEVKAIIDASKELFSAVDNLINSYYDRQLSKLDEQIEKQKELYQDAKDNEQELKDIAREKGLDADEAISVERERAKRAEAEQLRLDREKEAIQRKLAIYALIQQGLSSAEAISSIKGINDIKGFYEGTDTTVGAVLGRTSERDAHTIKVDGNEAIFNKEKTRALDIGHGNTTQDIVDMYQGFKGGILSSAVKSSLIIPEFQKSPIFMDNETKSLLKKVVDNTSPNNKPIDRTSFDTLTGTLEFQHKSKLKREKRTYIVRR